MSSRSSASRMAEFVATAVSVDSSPHKNIFFSRTNYFSLNTCSSVAHTWTRPFHLLLFLFLISPHFISASSKRHQSLQLREWTNQFSVLLITFLHSLMSSYSLHLISSTHPKILLKKRVNSIFVIRLTQLSFHSLDTIRIHCRGAQSARVLTHAFSISDHSSPVSLTVSFVSDGIRTVTTGPMSSQSSNGPTRALRVHAPPRYSRNVRAETAEPPTYVGDELPEYSDDIISVPSYNSREPSPT